MHNAILNVNAIHVNVIVANVNAVNVNAANVTVASVNVLMSMQSKHPMSLQLQPMSMQSIVTAVNVNQSMSLQSMSM